MASTIPNNSSLTYVFSSSYFHQFHLSCSQFSTFDFQIIICILLEGTLLHLSTLKIISPPSTRVANYLFPIPPQSYFHCIIRHFVTYTLHFTSCVRRKIQFHNFFKIFSQKVLTFQITSDMIIITKQTSFSQLNIESQ